MSSHDIKLREFIRPIPICQSEADLGSILNIFHQTNCSSLAISNQNNTWGIINSEDLLSLIAKSWQRLPIATISHPRTKLHQDNSFSYTARELHSLIKPATLYQADTSLSEFFQSLGENYFHTNQSNYLIVNCLGELQGKLDRDKLLAYTASKFNKDIEDNQLSPLSNSLWSLIDNLDLPLKIETSESKNCYQNQCWQKLIAKNHDVHSTPSQELNVSIAHWWMEKQMDVLEHENNQPKRQLNQFSKNKAGEVCYLEDNYYSSYQSKIVPQAIDIIGSNIENKEPDQSLAEDLNDHLNLELLNEYISEAQVEEDREWSYIKIPLKLKPSQLRKEQIFSSQRSEYWLIVAIKSSLLHLEDRQQKQPLTAAKSAVNKLLAAVSHELKSPLTGMIGLTNLLGSKQIGELNQRQTKYIQLINNSGLRLMAIVNSLIELTNLTTSDLPLQLEHIKLESLFQQLYQQILTKFSTISLDSTESDLLISTSGIESNIPSGLETAIADRSRLSSIVSHLMWETIQFHGSPSMALKIDVRKSHGYRAITIKSAANNSLVSDSEDTNFNNKDLGLSLIIARHLAQTLQGDVKSKYSTQSCSFTLLLPIIEPDRDNVPSTPNHAVKDCQTSQKNLTILCLYPELEVIDTSVGNNNGLAFNLKKWADQDWSNSDREQLAYRHRIIEADGLEQAHTLARIWQLNAIVLDGYQIANPDKYLRSLQESEYLSALPLITLDTKTTEAANQIEGLNVFPCLLPAQCRSIKDLMQVIQIATEQ